LPAEAIGCDLTAIILFLAGVRDNSAGAQKRARPVGQHPDLFGIGAGAIPGNDEAVGWQVPLQSLF
jgi:hypothetical protein